MKRRDFISLAGQSALMSAMGTACSRQQFLPDSRYLVDTPEKRKDYLAKMLKILCTDLGPRPTGSPACEKAALIIKREMELALPVVELDTFTFDKWVLNNEPELFVGDKQLEAYPMIETAGTPAEGISGILKSIDKNGYDYGIADRKSGEIIAYINIAFRNKAVPLYTYDKEMKRLPSVTVGKDDKPVLDAVLNNQTPIRMNVQTEIIPNSLTSNVVGTIPGESEDEILFLAHNDTVYSTQGANDNTASMICMLMLAHGISGTRPSKTITFVATTGEERGYKGAIHYAEKLKKERTYNNLKYVLNIDSITWGTNLWIWLQDEKLRALIESIDHELNVEGTPEFSMRDGFVDDSGPYRESGAQALYLNSKGFDNNDDLWHRPEDTPDMVPFECVEICYSVFHEFINRIQNI